MSTLKVLKEYLVGDGGYLLNDDNNGKTVMLSGAWGSGKTHFWQNEIIKEQKEIEKDGEKKKKYTQDEYESGLSYKLKDKKKACVYVSLYGKPSMEAIELDLYMNAYKNIVGDADSVSKLCSVFTGLGKNLGNMAHKGASNAFLWLEKLVNKDKFEEAGKYIEDGGLICFDDFERKSKNINLNDLFGFISQLTLEYNCKVIIILNSDVFKGEEANVFKTVKEKTVNKFFYFKPERRELFDSIYDRKDTKYEDLDAYREDIFNAIDETEELNARIYIQVLDNCLEWFDKGYDNDAIRCLVLTTIYFIKTNTILPYPLIGHVGTDNISLKYKNYLDVYTVISSYISLFGYRYRHKGKDELFDLLTAEINKRKKHSNIQEEKIVNWLQENFDGLFIFFKYAYKLFLAENIDKEVYIDIANFIKTGILSNKEEEQIS